MTRGYGGRLAGPVRVDPARHDAAAVGDEALLLARSGAVLGGARPGRRMPRRGRRPARKSIVLDDGFQNPGIAKDLSLVVIDAEYGFGNGRLIPAGPLREPVRSGLGARRCHRPDRRRRTAGSGAGGATAGFAGRSSTPVDAARFRGVRVVAFAGIGRPAKFFASLRRVGAEIVAARPFPDHHRFSPAEIAGLRREAERAGALLVTTAKDWVRLPAAARVGIETFEIELRWRDPTALPELLAPVLRPAGDGPVFRRKGLASRAAR